MPMQVFEEDGGRLVAVRISGKLAPADYEHLVPEVERLMAHYGKLRMLFDLTNFQGWEPSAFVDELKFDIKHYSDVERVAIIGDRKWEEEIATFYKPFTTAHVRYFSQGDAAEAWEWWREQPPALSVSPPDQRISV